MNKTHAATILVVDDTEENIDILVGLLKDYDVIIALDGPAALDILTRETVDIVLLDIIMPGMDGYEVCRIIKADARFKEIPVLFITARSDEASIEKAFDVGGVDYVTKPFKPRELMARLKTQLKLKNTLKALAYQATRDPMTGVYNRRRFFELGQKLFAETPADQLFAVMMDLDKFKQINDAHGHAFGDEVLMRFSSTIKSHLHPADVFGRLGGEEFGLLCSGKKRAEILNRVEAMRRAVECMDMENNGKPVRITVSKGIACKTTETRNLDHILKHADQALYQAKGSGRNKVIFR